MELLENYLDAIIAALIPVIILIIERITKPRAQLLLTNPHTFTYIVEEPLRDAEGNVIRPVQSAYTASYSIINDGKDTANSVEVVFNYKPQYCNIWPVVNMEEMEGQNNRYIYKIEALAPKERIQFELLSINAELPNVINAKCKEGLSKNVQTYPQPIAPNWKRNIAFSLLFIGSASTIYLIIFFLRLLIN